MRSGLKHPEFCHGERLKELWPGGGLEPRESWTDFCLTKGTFALYFYVQYFRRLLGYREISLQALHRVRVEDIPEKGLDLHFSDPKEEWNRYFHEIPECEFSFNEAVEATVKLRVYTKAVQIQGWVKTVLDLRCCRCLDHFPFPLTSQIDMTLFPETDVVQEEEIELEKEDLETGLFSGEEIDLSGLIREQILLNVPYKALCHDECKGLCSQCGTNLNENDCRCNRKGGDSAFDVLKDLKLNGK